MGREYTWDPVQSLPSMNLVCRLISFINIFNTKIHYRNSYRMDTKQIIKVFIPNIGIQIKGQSLQVSWLMGVWKQELKALKEC